MCRFFSFVTKGDEKPIFFPAEKRKEIALKGNPTGLRFDSHASICEYHGLDEDTVNKYEYDPFYKTFDIDSIYPENKDDSFAVEKWVKNYDFTEIFKTGCYDIEEIETLPEDFIMPEILYGNIFGEGTERWIKTHGLPKEVVGDVRLLRLDLTNVVMPKKVETLHISDSIVLGITLPQVMYKLSAIRCIFSPNTVIPEGTSDVDVEGASIPGMKFPKYLRHLDLFATERIETATLPKRVVHLRTKHAGSYGIICQHLM